MAHEPVVCFGPKSALPNYPLLHMYATAHVLYACYAHPINTFSKQVDNPWYNLNMYNFYLPINVFPFATESSCVGQPQTHSSSTFKDWLKVGVITLAQLTTLKIKK